MTGHHAPRLAVALLEHFLPDSGPLAGYLIEDFERRQSTAWFYWQVLAAIVTASHKRPYEIRPLRLVELQPADALERSRRMSIRFRTVNLSASPLSGVGGLGLAALAFLVTIVEPGAWWVLLASISAAALLAALIVAIRAQLPDPVTTIRSL